MDFSLCLAARDHRPKVGATGQWYPHLRDRLAAKRSTKQHEAVIVLIRELSWIALAKLKKTRNPDQDTTQWSVSFAFNLNDSYDAGVAQFKTLIKPEARLAQ